MWPHFAEDEIQAVVDVLHSGKINYWTGDEGRQFEKEFASFHGMNYAVALTNGTVAIELALHVLGIGPGDEVITTPRTFLATASSIVLAGATPIFVDVCPISQNITAETIEKAITKKTKAIIPVHLAGWPCEMDKIMDLATKHGLYVIEDCAQAHGAKYKGKLVGSWGHINCFSFCQDKIMSTGGEGGMVVMNDKQWWEKAWSYKDHGKSYDAVYNKEHKPGFRWLHHSFGTNWRLTEMQSAIGRIQLKKLTNWVNRRHEIATYYNDQFKSHDLLQLTLPSEDIYHSYYRYYALLNLENLKSDWSRDKVIAEINSKGVPCYHGSCSEVFKEECFKAIGYVSPSLPNAQVLDKRSIMLLVHPTLTDHDIEKITSNVLSVLNAALK